MKMSEKQFFIKNQKMCRLDVKRPFWKEEEKEKQRQSQKKNTINVE